jgi:hypothetical protein
MGPTRPAQDAIVPAADATVCVMFASFAVNLTTGLSAAKMLMEKAE